MVQMLIIIERSDIVEIIMLIILTSGTISRKFNLLSDSLKATYLVLD